MMGKVYIQSSIQMMKNALNKVDKEPVPSPIQSTIRTDLEHKTSSKETSEKVKCLFSMN